MKLFCIPYAGGTANIYQEWKNVFGSKVEVCPIEYIGHGSLFGKGYYQTINEAAEDILNRYIINNSSPYMIYGHSLGCLVAFEIAAMIMERNIPKPEHIIFASMRPPHFLYKRKNTVVFQKMIF